MEELEVVDLDSEVTSLWNQSLGLPFANSLCRVSTRGMFSVHSGYSVVGEFSPWLGEKLVVMRKDEDND